MNPITVIANTSESVPEIAGDEQLVWMIGAAIFFLLGFFTGWIIWKQFRPEAKRLERENRRLMAAYENREKEYIEHKDIVSALIERQPGD